MSKIPLRTSELWEASNKPRASEDNRPSRSTNFFRSGSSTNLRNGSIDRLTSSTNSKQFISNSAIKPRSLSVNATPRTPNYQRPPVSFLTTAEKAETFNKKWIHTETNNILEYLKLHGREFDNSFFHKNHPLKSMSTKQFVLILNIFLKKIGGPNLKATSEPDSIIKILSELEYPSQVTKSWLKTPCAPHAHTNVIQLFSELRNLADESIDYFEEETFKVSKSHIEAFTAWNNFNTKEYDQIKETLCNEYLQERYQIESLEAFNNEIVLLEVDIQELKERKPNINRREKLLEIEKEYKKSEQNVLKLESICKLDDKKFTELKLQKATNIKLVEDTENNIIELKERLKLQKMSSEEYFKLTEEINQLIMQVETYNKKNIELKDCNYKNQVSESRLIQQKMELLMEYNGIISSISPYLKTEGNIFQIDKDVVPSRLEEIHKFWGNFNLNHRNETDLKEAEVKSSGHKLELLQHQFNISNDNLKEIIKNINTEEELFLRQEKELLNIRNIDAKSHNDKIDKLNAMRLNIQKLKNEVEIKNEFLQQFEKKNEDDWKAIEQNVDETIENKNLKLEEIEKFCDEFQKQIAELKETAQDVLDK